MSSNTYGYIRVSTREQNEDRQLIALQEMSIPEQNIFMDKQSGKDLMGTFLSDIVLQVLSFVAENERTNIRQRQQGGIAAAKARGEVRQTAKATPRELPQHLPAVEVWSNYRYGSSKGVRDASVHLLIPSGNLQKSQDIVKGTDLQKRVPFCKSVPLWQYT